MMLGIAWRARRMRIPEWQGQPANREYKRTLVQSWPMRLGNFPHSVDFRSAEAHGRGILADSQVNNRERLA